MIDTSPNNVSIVIPAKEETTTLQRCLTALELAHYDNLECLVVGDRISLQSAEKHTWVKKILADVPLEEAVELGIQTSRNELILKVDADIILPKDLLQRFLAELDSHSLVSCPASTRCTTLWLNLFFIGRDFLDKIAPIGRSTHGNSVLFKKSDVEALGGFRLNSRLHQLYQDSGKPITILGNLRVSEFREDYSLTMIVNRQLTSGRKRFELGNGFWRTLFHAIMRIRPFVIAGWLQRRLTR
jgi:glycosyltransferase involved in cell wall biosynthesis